MTAATLSADEALEQIGVAALQPQEVVFWSGAGISRDRPTAAPLGHELTERVLDCLFERDCLETIVRYYRELAIDRPFPRLETVLDVVSRIDGVAALADVLSDVRRPPPNDLHRFFARHLEAGGRHITANFDDAIERSRASPAAANEPVHFHGSFARDPTGATLGATLASIQRGFPRTTVHELEERLTSSSTRAIVFVGYGGYDAFDVDPFLRSLRDTGAFVGMDVVWVRYDGTGTTDVALNRTSTDDRVDAALGCFREGGADSYELRGELRAVLASFAASWGFSPVTLHTRPAAPTWAPTFTPTPAEIWRATLELYAMMGLHTEVRRLLALRGPAAPDEWALAAHTTAAAGCYRDAEAEWRRAMPESSPLARATRAQHIASLWWREGRLVRAYRHLRKEIDEAERAGVTGEPIWLLAGMLANVLSHMQRRPALRFCVTQRKKRFVRKRLPGDDPDYRSRGPHLDALLASTRSRVATPTRHSDEASAAFDEAEALHGMLNFRHASLRQRGSTRNRADHPTPDEYRKQRRDFMVIGLDADAARVPLLPGAARTFAPGDVWRGLRTIDFTLWHRLTLFVGYLVRYALGR